MNMGEIEGYDYIRRQFLRAREVFRSIPNASDVNKEDPEGNTPLHHALKEIQSTTYLIVMEMLERGALVNKTNHYGMTPIHVALKYKNNSIELLSLLLRRGANVLLKDASDYTPIDYALLEEDTPVDVIKLLIEKVSNPQRINESGNSVLHRAIQNPSLPIDVRQLLRDNGADNLELTTSAESTIHIAVECVRKDVLKYLLKKPGVKIILSDGMGYSPLHHAVTNPKCKPNSVKVLLESGADIHQTSELGAQALHMAMVWCQEDVIELLLKFGARVNVLDGSHRSPLFLAIKFGLHENIEGVKLLLEAGALVFADHQVRKSLSLGNWTLDRTRCPLYVAAQSHNILKSELSLRQLQLLLKYALLEMPQLSLENFCNGKQTCALLEQLKDEYLHELHSICFEGNVTLAQFILRLRLKEDKDYLTDEILDILAANTHPLYREVVFGLMSRQDLVDKFKDGTVYAVQKCPHSTRLVRRIALSHDSLGFVMRYLSKEDVLSLRLAYHHARDGHIDFPSVASKTVREAIAAESERFFKRARMN